MCLGVGFYFPSHYPGYSLVAFKLKTYPSLLGDFVISFDIFSPMLTWTLPACICCTTDPLILRLLFFKTILLQNISIDKSSPPKAIIKFDKIVKNNHFSILEIEQKHTTNRVAVKKQQQQQTTGPWIRIWDWGVSVWSFSHSLVLWLIVLPQ